MDELKEYLRIGGKEKGQKTGENEIRQLARMTEFRTPHENKLNMYYNIGRMIGRESGPSNSNKEKVELYNKLLDSYYLKARDSEHPNQYLVLIYDFIQYIQFIGGF
jgi:hypothetical protein